MSLIMIGTLASFIAAGARYTILLKRHTLLQTQLYQQPVHITGQLINKEQRPTNSFKNILYLQPHTITILTTKQNIKTTLPIKIYFADDIDDINVPIGATVLIERLYWPNRPTTRQSLSLLSQGLAGTLFVRNTPITVLKRHCSHWDNLKLFGARWRYAITERLRKKMSPQSFQLFNSFFLGAPLPVTAFTQTFKNDLQRWGLLHFLARSGFHVLLLATIWGYILKPLPLTYGIVNLLLCILLLIFSLISWPAASFYRAVSSFVLSQFFAFKTGITFPLHILTLVCYVMLLINPFHLFFIGFQLSFLLSATLILFGEIKRREKRIPMV